MKIKLIFILSLLTSFVINTFNNTTNPYCFVSNGNLGNISISNIETNTNGTMNFDICFYYDQDNITYSNTSSLPSLSRAGNSIITTENVVVKNTDEIVFESGNYVILNHGFEVKKGGIFEINIKQCP
jgi:hypothetical protein